MSIYHVIVRTELERYRYIAIANSSCDAANDALSKFGLCSVSVKLAARN